MRISADERYGGRPSVPAKHLDASAYRRAAREEDPVGWPDKMEFSIIVFRAPSHPKSLSAGSLSSADCKGAPSSLVLSRWG